jgi:hypothetical protein
VLIVKKNSFVTKKGPNSKPEYETRARRLMDMGVESNTAYSVLSAQNWDLERATESIFG